jgi:hypothetical protein
VEIDSCVKDIENNLEILVNMLRILNMLEKAVDRIGRKNFHSKAEYPEILLELESYINLIRSWIQGYKYFCNVPTFINTIGLFIAKIAQITVELSNTIKPKNGKRKEKKSRLEKEGENIFKSIQSMMDHLSVIFGELKPSETTIGIEIENALWRLFERHCSKPLDLKKRELISKRGKKTQIFPCSDKDEYLSLVNDRERYKKEVLNKLHSYERSAGHKDNCDGKCGYRLRGFRTSARRIIVKGGEKRQFPIRIAECKGCGEKFSLLPSFLPREKHFCIDIIGAILRGVFLFKNSLRSAIANTELTGARVKSQQTILNWIKWVGAHHPAIVLTRAGVKGSGYFQEDEGFEKEPNLRTYSVVMVDPENFLVWHIDYVDHVDEQTLCESFEKFVDKIDFNVLGVAKDKWRASTNALKSVFHKIWIGFCHRHCLKKFYNALLDYQKEVGCSQKEVNDLYKKFKKALDEGGSQAALKVKIGMLKEPAFKHPAIRSALEEVEKNAANYTAHKSRKGIKKTTSIVDNFLKTVKRKLRQVESFRDGNWTGILLRGMANVRNFVPFMSGAKNAHKSPFMLAKGETYGLPWIQTMNMHNAFLFCDI